MAYNDANLVVARKFDTQGNDGTSPRGYTYSTSDTVATVKGSNYWDGAIHKLRPGDLVAVTADDGKFLGVVSSVDLGGAPEVSLSDVATVSTFNGW